MQTILNRVWSEEDGALSFEWCLVAVLLAFGIVSGLSAARDGILDELSDVAESVLHLDQSFSFPGILCIPDSQFVDDPGDVVDCARSNLPGQPAADDVDS
jgi:Flp pilus assembly pilin Flp